MVAHSTGVAIECGVVVRRHGARAREAGSTKTIRLRT